MWRGPRLRINGAVRRRRWLVAPRRGSVQADLVELLQRFGHHQGYRTGGLEAEVPRVGIPEERVDDH